MYLKKCSFCVYVNFILLSHGSLCVRLGHYTVEVVLQMIELMLLKIEIFWKLRIDLRVPREGINSVSLK